MTDEQRLRDAVIAYREEYTSLGHLESDEYHLGSQDYTKAEAEEVRLNSSFTAALEAYATFVRVRARVETATEIAAADCGEILQPGGADDGKPACFDHEEPRGDGMGVLIHVPCKAHELLAALTSSHGAAVTGAAAVSGEAETAKQPPDVSLGG